MNERLRNEKLSLEEIRRRADEWFSRGGREALARALEEGAAASLEFQKSAWADPKELAEPMTV